MLQVDTLALFTGSDQLLFHPLFRGINYTSGVAHVQRNTSLVTDILGALKHHPKVTAAYAADPFLVIDYDHSKRRVEVKLDGGEVIYKIPSCHYDIDGDVGFFYMDGVLMLKSEY